MDYLDRVKEEFTRQADTFAVHAVKADEKVESRFQGAIGDAGKGVLLDVACGPGVVTAALTQNAARITAFDATPAMLEKARARCEEAGLANVEFREGDAQAMPFDDATFDGIVTRLAIHHFAEPAKVMSEMYRVLKPGGCAVISSMSSCPTMRKKLPCRTRSKSFAILRTSACCPKLNFSAKSKTPVLQFKTSQGGKRTGSSRNGAVSRTTHSESDRCASSPTLSRETAGTQGSDFP